MRRESLRGPLLVVAFASVIAPIARSEVPPFTAPGSAVPPSQDPPVVSDYNGDGHLDIAGGAILPDLSNGANFAAGDGTGSFAAPSVAGVLQSTGRGVAADFDGDGRAEAALANTYSSQFTPPYRSTRVSVSPAGVASLTTIVQESNAIADFSAGDIDADGDVDLLYRRFFGATRVIYNTVTGSPTRSSQRAGSTGASLAFPSSTAVRRDCSGGRRSPRGAMECAGRSPTSTRTADSIS